MEISRLGSEIDRHSFGCFLFYVGERHLENWERWLDNFDSAKNSSRLVGFNQFVYSTHLGEDFQLNRACVSSKWGSDKA